MSEAGKMRNGGSRLTLFCAAFAMNLAQVAARGQQPESPPLYSIDLQSRLVVEDVSVLDRQDPGMLISN